MEDCMSIPAGWLCYLSPEVGANKQTQVTKYLNQQINKKQTNKKQTNKQKLNKQTNKQTKLNKQTNQQTNKMGDSHSSDVGPYFFSTCL